MSRGEIVQLLARHDSLQRTLDELQHAHGELKESNDDLARQVAWFRQQLFGSKSERRISEPGHQLHLGELGDADSTRPSTEVEVAAHRRRPRVSRQDEEGGFRFDPSVPVVTVVVPNEEVPAAERDNYYVVGQKVTDRLGQRPASYVVIREIREVLKRKSDGLFSCPPAPGSVLEGSIADVSFLAGLVIDKLSYHLPLYRQHQRLAAAGIHMGRSTLTTYFQRTADLLEPIYDAQLASILESDVLAMDETPIKAGRKKNKPPGRGRMKTGYFWPIYGDRDEVAFPFADTRAHAVVYETLKDYCGTLLTDGYEAYDRYAEATSKVELAHCWVHVRRKFLEAELVEPGLADEALTRIATLYEHDEQCRALPGGPDEVLGYRQKHCAPIVDAFFTSLTEALDNQALLPTNPFTKAARYAVDREASLRVFLRHPGVQMDTNHLERALRPIALGRKNWLFCSTEVGAKQVGVIQSLLVTCRLHGLDAYTYLVDVLQRVQVHPAKRVHELTPRLWAENFAESPMRSALFSQSG